MNPTEYPARHAADISPRRWIRWHWLSLGSPQGGQTTAELAILLLLVAVGCLAAGDALVQAVNHGIARTASFLSTPLP